MDKETIPLMVNPQAENGHLDLAHEIIEKFFNLQLSGNQWRILWVILRQTYGWKKKVERISITTFEKKTGLHRRHIHRALKDMIDRKIITKNDTTFIVTYGFQKDYSKWELLPKMSPLKTVTKNVTGSLPKLVTKPLPKLVTIKEKKETTKKKGGTIPSSLKTLELFLKEKAIEVYESYPKKADRPNSLKSIEKIFKAYQVELLPCPVPGLKLVIQNYRKTIEAEGTERKYIIQSNNFFGQAERWREFLQPPRAQVGTW
jgi:phage replication O-like protein O